MLKKILKTIGVILTYLIFSISVIAFVSLLWMFHTWQNLSPDELFFQLKNSIAGTNADMIRAYILPYGLIWFLSILLAVIVGLLLYRKKRIIFRFTACLWLVSLFCLIFGSYLTNKKLDLIHFLKNENTNSEFIKEHYVDPAEVSITFPEKKRNLIYIYLESMESTYADTQSGGGFEDKNVIPELCELSYENESFSGNRKLINGGIPMYSCTWTMAGLFAQTSGLPLKVSIHGNEMNTQTSFFPGVTSLGDILAKEGYQNIFMCGSDITFAGRQKYFQQHGNYTLMDYYYAKNQAWIPKDYQVWWGYEDEKLIANAKRTLTELATSSKPFNFSMLTVDTHFEDGYVCENCENEYGDDQYSNVIACSSKQISEFVSWIQEQDFYANTTIILCGDHATMDSDYCNSVSSDYIRKTYTTIINSAKENKNPSIPRVYTTMDLFPTTLAALGASIEGDKLGLGTNLYAGCQTLVEEYGYKTLNEHLKLHSDFMDSLADLTMSKALKQDTVNSSALNLNVIDLQYNLVDLHLTDSMDLSIDWIDKITYTITPEGADPIVVPPQVEGETLNYHYYLDLKSLPSDSFTVSVDLHLKDTAPLELIYKRYKIYNLLGDPVFGAKFIGNEERLIALRIPIKRNVFTKGKHYHHF